MNLLDDNGKLRARLFSWQRADELVGVFCLLLIVFSIIWGVLTRYVFSQSASWSFELAVIAFGWMVFLAPPLAYDIGCTRISMPLSPDFPGRYARW